MLPLMLEDPVGVAPLSAFSVATPAPDTRTVPTGGTAGASVRSVSRSRPWAVAAEAKANRTRIGRRMEGRRVPRSRDSVKSVRGESVDAARSLCHIPAPVSRSYFIHTFGCQMNESDSQRMAEALASAGWVPAEAPERADLVLVNTCAIREKAEDKLYSDRAGVRSEEHTSELQSRGHLVCRLLLEKKKELTD